MRYAHMLFDLDGTILKTDFGYERANQYACLKMGILDFPYERTDLFIGPSLESFLIGFLRFSPEKAEQFKMYFYEYYDARGARECEPYEGILTLLEEIRLNNGKVYICTAKPLAVAHEIVRNFGIKVDQVFGAEGLRIEKQDILAHSLMSIVNSEREKCVMIGDRYTDLQAGKLCGIETVGVTYGYGSMEEICKCTPTHIAEDVRSLRNYLFA